MLEGQRLTNALLEMMQHLCELVKKTHDLSFPAATIQTLAEFSQQIQGNLPLSLPLWISPGVPSQDDGGVHP